MMNKLKHAKHNESVCHFLSPKQNFADWVVITAFYSAIHYIDHRIFPLKIENTTFHSIEQYHLYIKNNFGGVDKHGSRANLVCEQCSAINSAFKWLLSTCHTARYTNYEFIKPRDTSKMAQEYLREIKAYCIKTAA